MNIEIYKNNSDNIVVNKNITKIKTVSVQLIDNTDVLTPSFILYDDVKSEYDYCYIKDFNRYYYITDKTMINGKRMSISCKVDVLQSFASDIKSSYGIVEETAGNINNYIASEIWTPDVRQYTSVLNFSGGFNDNPEYILLTAGGYAN